MKSLFSPVIGLLAISAMVAVSGCQRVALTDRVPNDNPQLSFSPSILSAPIVAETMAATRAGSAELPTATKTVFADGDKFGMYLSRSMDLLILGPNIMRGFDYSNIGYTRAGGVFTTDAGTPPGTIYYPYKDIKIDMWGIYPFDVLAKTKDPDTYAWPVKTNQSTENSVLTSDFLTARVKEIDPAAGASVNLQFEHKMTRLRLEMDVPGEVDGKAVDHTQAIDKIFFEGMSSVGYYNFNTNVVSTKESDPVVGIVPLFRGSENIDPANASLGMKYYYEAVVVPQMLKAGSLFLRVIVNYTSTASVSQGLFTLELPADFTLQMGKQHSYTVVFDNKLRLRLEGTKILDWDAVSDVNEGLDETETVMIGDVMWARGNLVANGKNGCKIGKPEDGGLYFQFGSLVGYAGGADGSGVGVCAKADAQFWGGAAFAFAQDVRVSPSIYTPSHQNWPTFVSQSAGGFGYFYFADYATNYTDFKLDHRSNNPLMGIGDPCEYYLGKPWRLPNSTELSSITGSAIENSWVAWGDAGITAAKTTTGPNGATGAWFGQTAKTNPQLTTDLFLPASGRRVATGAFDATGKSGMIVGTSVGSGTQAYSTWFNETTGVNPRFNNVRESAYPVRCVKK